MPNNFKSPETLAKLPYRLDIQLPNGTWQTRYSWEKYLKRPDQGKGALVSYGLRFVPKVRAYLLDNLRLRQCPFPPGSAERREWYGSCILEELK